MKDVVEIKSLFRESEKYADQEIVVEGWVRTNRGSNKFGFIELNDGTFFKSVQVVYEAEFLDNFEEISKAPVAAALKVTGNFVLTPNAKQPFEIKAKEIVIEAGSEADYPLQKKRHSMEFLREIAHLRPRSNTFSAVFRVRSIVAYAIHKFFQENNFVYAHTPIITASDCEGAGEMFQITTLDMDNPPRTEDGEIDYSQDFFGKKASLTGSGDLCTGLQERIHLRTDFPCGKLQHGKTRIRILDDRAGNGLCRSDGRYERGRSHDQIHHQLRAGKRTGRDGILQ